MDNVYISLKATALYAQAEILEREAKELLLKAKQIREEANTMISNETFKDI